MSKKHKAIYRKQYIICLPFCLWFCFWIWQAKDHAFFWDTVQLASKQAHWYFDHDFQHFFLPRDIDSGHPPSFGMALAGLWKVFGRELWVGHLAMMPFLIGIVLLGYRIGQYFLPADKVVWLLLLLAVDPFILGQSVLVSPDIIVLFGWLLGIYAVLYQRAWWKAAACVLLAMVSMRGMMLVLVLFLFDLVRQWQTSRITLGLIWRSIPPYLPAGLVGIGFLWAHYLASGWTGYHADSPWAPSFARSDWGDAIYNVGLLVWRLIDFGRVLLCLFLLWGVVYVWTKKPAGSKGKTLLWWLGLTVVVLCPAFVMHQHLTAHRYLIPITTVMSFLGVYWLATLVRSTSWQRAVYASIFAVLLLGNAWVYPDKVAQGWDSTMAHWPYYDLRKQMLTFIRQQNIDLEQIGTAFPNVSALRYIDLSDDPRGMQLYDNDKHTYIFYSNVFNDIADEDLDEWQSRWKVVQQFDRCKIKVILYKNPTRE